MSTVNNIRMEKIHQILTNTFAPDLLEIIDDSHLHAGHASAGGAGHFRVKIVSAKMAGLSRVARHQAVFTAVKPLLGADIHALSIIAKTPQEEEGS